MTSILLSVAFLALVGWSGATTPFILDACSGAKPGIPADIAAQRGAALAYGNEYRRRHGAKPLTVDPTLEAEAQKRAEYMASTRIFSHGAYSGDNWARIPCDNGVKQVFPTEPTIPGAVYRWTLEVPFRCRNPAENQSIFVGDSIPGFSRMVWKASEKVGYGASVTTDGHIIVVARYSPLADKDPAAAMENMQCERIP
ncbi:Golgi-associated plant pathogenesis-related protein 1 [Folsomia candida]|uniref:Golgi-associated plant pathogenesis-related protein 1 n=1 Tax=Folsomia candida TaxID=158441 RepID=A0A226DW00_FOLCA|nr:Golgi-associated plant pathogenesis-related protein 1 [Folsomia candida]